MIQNGSSFKTIKFNKIQPEIQVVFYSYYKKSLNTYFRLTFCLTNSLLFIILETIKSQVPGIMLSPSPRHPTPEIILLFLN